MSERDLQGTTGISPSLAYAWNSSARIPRLKAEGWGNDGTVRRRRLNKYHARQGVVVYSP